MISDNDWPRFCKGAAPGAIEYELKQAERRLANARHDYARLLALLRTRRGEIERGQWPPAKQGEIASEPAKERA